MRHQPASLRAGVRYRNSAAIYAELPASSSTVSEREHPYLGGRSARSLHGPPRATSAVAGHPTGVLDRDLQESIQSGDPILTESVVHAFVRDRESRGRSPETIRCYLESLRGWPELWPESADDLAPALEKARSRSAYSRHTRMNHWRVLGRWAEETFGLPNIAANLPLGRKSGGLPKLPAKADVETLFRTCSTNRELAMVSLLFGTGIRFGEIPFERKLIGSDRFTTGDGKSGSRTLPLPVDVADLLASIGDETHLWLTERPGDPKHDRKPMRPWGLRNMWRRVVARAGVRVTPHQARHYFAVDMLEAGVDLRTIQILLGHGSISTTSLYLALTTDHLSAVVQSKNPLTRLNRRDAE